MIEVKATETLLDGKRFELVHRRETLIHQLAQAARCHEDQRARQALEHIELTNEFIVTLDGVAAEARAQKAAARRRYVVSSLFLHESFRKLTATSSSSSSPARRSRERSCSISGPSSLTRSVA